MNFHETPCNSFEFSWNSLKFLYIFMKSLRIPFNCHGVSWIHPDVMTLDENPFRFHYFGWNRESGKCFHPESLIFLDIHWYYQGMDPGWISNRNHEIGWNGWNGMKMMHRFHDLAWKSIPDPGWATTMPHTPKTVICITFWQFLRRVREFLLGVWPFLLSVGP